MHLPNPQLTPPHIAKLMTAEARKQIGAELPSESSAKYERREEQKMHRQFANWLYLNKIHFVHSRMDRKSTTAAGTPDFICVKGRFCCFLEMKAPGGRLSEVQKSYVQKLEADHIPVLVAYSVQDAIEFCKERLL
jgi:hypothetical protein